MGKVRHIDSGSDRWVWIESVPMPLVVLSLVSGTVAALNSAARSTLDVSNTDLVGKSVAYLVPEYLLPRQEVVAQWIEQALAGQTPGFSIDLLTESPDSGAVRLSAYIGPADGSGEFVLLSLNPPTGDGELSALGTEDVLRGLMSDIGRIVGSSLDLGTVCQQFAISLMQVVPADHVAILLAAGESESLNIMFSSVQGQSQREPDSRMLTPAPGTPVSRAMQTHTALLLNEAEISELAAFDAGSSAYFGKGMRSVCCVPFVASGNCIGVVLLGSSQLEAFGTDDLTLLEQASSQVAGAISNVMLHEALTQSALERDVLANIGRLAGAAIEFAGAMPGIAAEIRRIMPVSELCVCEPDSSSGELTRSYGWTESGKQITYDAKSSVDAARSRELCLMGSDGVISTMMEAGSSQPCAAVTTPLRFGGETIGTLTVISAGTEKYAARETSFASLVAGHIAGAVQTARVYHEQQRESDLRRTLAQISVAASRDLAPDSVFERVANEVAELVEYDLFAIALPRPDRSGLTFRFQIGHDGPLMVYDDEKPDISTDSYEWRARIIRPAGGFPQFAALADHGINSLIEVSLGAEETGATGYILIGAGSELTFTKQDLRTMVHVAGQVSPAIQNAMAHEQAVALAEARMSEAKAEARSLELERINDAKSRFLSVVSHELRTPLTSIIAFAELLERNTDGNLDAKQLKQAAVINKSATHLKFLISDLLDVSRIESGNISLELSTFDIGDAVWEVVELFEPVLDEKEQVFEVHLPQESIEIRADRSRIVQIVSNLIENASKYSPPRTVVTVDVHRRGREILITVSDEGIGISEEDQRQLFVPFFRANSELTRTEPGTGLGLSLVKSITELHGGSVAVHSEPGKGSTFSVALKAALAKEAA